MVNKDADKSDEGKNWSEHPVYRNAKYTSLVETLCQKENDATNKPIFSTNRELMIFAAMVGFTEKKKEKLDKGENIQIFMRVYETCGQDGYIYLLGLIETQDPSILKDAGLRSVIALFEEYCNGGLSVIQSWMDENKHDIGGSETLLVKIHQQLEKITPKNRVDEDVDIRF